MARADLLIHLAQSALKGDKTSLRKVIEAIIAEERSKQHHVLANRLDEILTNYSLDKSGTNGQAIADLRIGGLVYEIMPSKKLDDLIIPDDVRQICNDLINEHYRIDLLRSYNIEPRNRILLIGPPGNGKTTMAEAIAEALMVPLLVVRYESIVGTFLGETSVRLKKLFEYAATRKCVLFFDEFETLGKERGDIHETGEIKRVVSSLLLQIDDLPSHVVVIGATNHSELLDRAVWRRFQVRMNLPKPTRRRLVEWFQKFETRTGVKFDWSSETLSKKLQGLSFSEIEEFGLSVFRQYVLDQPTNDMKKIVSRTLKYWSIRTVKTISENELEE